MIEPARRASAFGLLWRSDIALDGFDPADEDADAVGVPVDVYRVDSLPNRVGGRPVDRGFLYDDGVRFVWGEEVAFDIIGGTAIAYCPGQKWTGTMPVSFYSTVAALTAAWRGLVPLHASAVELDGRAVLIAGLSGAGKSTLTAGLLALGAGFVADDLVILSVHDDGPIRVPNGRPTIRLHPDTAGSLDTSHAAPALDDPTGKWLAWPRRRHVGEALELGAIILLERDDSPSITDARSWRAARLLAHIFRRRRLAALPMYAALVRQVLSIGARVPILVYPAQSDCTLAARLHRTENALARIRAALASNP